MAVVTLLAMGFNYTNGFHDAANAIATSVSTRALTPRVALVMAAVMNFVGAFLGQKVASTVSDVIDPGVGSHGLVIVMAGLLGAITWNLVTWYYGLPSSSSHALIGGLVGSALTAGVFVNWATVVEKVVIPMVLSPIAGILLGYLVMTAILWIFRGSNPHRVSRGFRYAQTLSAAAMAFGHGLQDASKTAGVVVLALTVAGVHEGPSIPLWVLAFGLTYGALDEIFQPLVRRDAELLDWVADACGVWSAVVILWLLQRMLIPRSKRDEVSEVPSASSA